jgi:hypothetical protein
MSKIKNLILVVVLATTMLFSIAAAPIPAPATVSINPNPVTYGQPATITAIVDHRQNANHPSYSKGLCIQTIDGQPAFWYQADNFTATRNPNGTFTYTGTLSLSESYAQYGQVDCKGDFLSYVSKDKTYGNEATLIFTINPITP